jgi:hypothetical protein
MERKDAELTIHILAGVQAVISAVALLGAVVALVVFSMPWVFGLPRIMFLLTFVMVFAALIAAASMYIAYKAYRREEWARIGMIVLGAISLLSFPLGTILGAAHIYFFGFNEDVKALYRPKATKRAAKKTSKKRKRAKKV